MVIIKPGEISRRRFLQQSIQLAGIASLAMPTGFGCDRMNADEISITMGAAQSRVVLAQSNTVRTKTGLSGAAIQNLLNTAMENLFQVSSAQKAWRKLVSPQDTVGLKPNCLAGKGLSTSLELVDTVVENLLQVGVKRHNIIIWERLNDDLERAGYKIYYGNNQVQCYGNDYAGYTQDLYEYGRIGSLLSRVVTTRCSVLINLPILKDHGIVGLSGGLKNYFGGIHNPNKYHDHIGDPYVADVNCLAPFKNKTKLTICDALTAQYDGGPPFMPQWTWHCNSVLLAADMVALDEVCRRIIEDKRKEKGRPSLKEVGRDPTYIATAADANHRLGTNDSTRIELIEC